MKQLTIQNEIRTESGLAGPGRHAFTMIEVVVALFLLFACLTTFAQLRAMLVSQYQRFNSVDIARHQLLNVWEILGNESDDAILSGTFRKDRLEALVANTLPQGKIEFKVVPLVFEGKTQTDRTDSNAADEVKKTNEDTTPHLVQAIISWYDGPNRPQRSLILSRLLP